MLAKCHSATIVGVDAVRVDVEVDAVKSDAPRWTIVGLADTAVKESRERVANAVRNSRYNPRTSLAVTFNLAPAHLHKAGTQYDLPMALGILGATGKIDAARLDDWGIAGELALSGAVRKVNGILPFVIGMKETGKKAVLIPKENLKEASIVDGIDIVGVESLDEAAGFIEGSVELPINHSSFNPADAALNDYDDDFSDVKGQETIKRAVEVAVAGGHNILMVGSPGSGKTMIARRIPSILPPMTFDEAIEVSKIYSIVGAAKASSPLVTHRPFRSPHHTASSIALLGGGSHPAPGEVSLAHRGVLFLDEFAEFPRAVLDVLRQPLEDGFVSVARAAAAYKFPARFMLVAAMNPCPCGYYGDDGGKCRCNQTAIMKYQARISGPLLDRIDIQVGVHAVPPKDLASLKNGERSAAIRERVAAARAIQAERYASMPGIHTNAEAKGRDLPEICRLTGQARDEVRRIIEALDLSARAYDRVLRVARTIADLDGRRDVAQCDIFEASSYRRLDRQSGSFWI